MQLVILAAGHGRRFGGLKQLAPIGPHDEAIMDYTASAAQECGFDSVVLVVREDIREEIAAHIRGAWPRELPVEFVCQDSGPPGTVQAVLCAQPVLEGPFAVANADDLYSAPALAPLVSHFKRSEGLASVSPHLLVGYRLVHTVLTQAPVTRGLCRIASNDLLEAIVEQVVERRADGGFDARPLGHPEAPVQLLSGSELVSMNLWGFHLRILEHLEQAVENFDPAEAARKELILPGMINEVVSSRRDEVEVRETNEPCIGITHQEDLAIAREALLANTDFPGLLKSTPRS